MLEAVLLPPAQARHSPAVQCLYLAHHRLRPLPDRSQAPAQHYMSRQRVCSVVAEPRIVCALQSVKSADKARVESIPCSTPLGMRMTPTMRQE